MSSTEIRRDPAAGSPNAGDGRHEARGRRHPRLGRRSREGRSTWSLGWRLDADFADGDGFRIVQLTPPGSACSIQFGTGVTSAAPGSAQGLYLVVSDIEAARDELVARGVEVSEVFHERALGDRFHADGRVSGPRPTRATYGSFASFSDPDGNGWLLQEITTRLPGRVDAAATTFASVGDLASALRRAAAAHGEHEKRTGEADANWPDWYAAYMVAEAGGTELPRMTDAGASGRSPGKTVVVIGGSAGIGLETARLAREEGADVDPHGARPGAPARGRRASSAPASRPSTPPTSTGSSSFFDELPAPIDHVLVTGPGPYYAPLRGLRPRRGAPRRRGASPAAAAGRAATPIGKVRPGGTLLFMGGTGGRRTAPGLALIAALTAAMPALTKNLALELAPIRVNLIAAGFVDTPLSAALLGDQLDARREQLRDTLPIRRVVGPADIAALAVHLMTNTAVTGATFDIDGGQQLVEQ